MHQMRGIKNWWGTQWRRWWPLGFERIKKGKWWWKILAWKIKMKTRMTLIEDRMRKMYMIRLFQRVRTLLFTVMLSSFYWLESTVRTAVSIKIRVSRPLTIIYLSLITKKVLWRNQSTQRSEHSQSSTWAPFATSIKIFTPQWLCFAPS